MRLTTKMLGDAGEHYALSQIAFAGLPAAKMPDGWESYDLVVDRDGERLRVSVKTRSQTAGWKASPWFAFDERRECDWFVFVFRPSASAIRSWIVPFEVACANANSIGKERKEPHMRDLSLAKLNRAPLAAYEGNWTLSLMPTIETALLVEADA